MSDHQSILSELINLTRSLGDPARDLAILGEGNTSAQIDLETFYVKASGKHMGNADENTFVECSIARALDSLNGPDLSDEEVRSALLRCRTDQTSNLTPSVETFLHAYLLSLKDINWVGHTHPTAVNAILCAENSKEAVSGRLFPDEIVCCGPAVCYVDYTDPGLPLARHLRLRVEEFIDAHNMAPKVILMENHGFIATGKTVRDVETTTSMYVKTARILLGTFTMGGPRYMTQQNVDRIHSRPDEHYRQKQIGQG